MSLKNKDEHNRWRNKTVAFRVSPEEWEQIERYVGPQSIKQTSKRANFTKNLFLPDQERGRYCENEV